MGDRTELICWFSLSVIFSALKIPTGKVLNASIHPMLCIYHLNQKDFLGNEASPSS